MRCAIRLLSLTRRQGGDSSAGKRLVVKLILVGPGRELEAGYRGTRRTPFGPWTVDCLTQSVPHVAAQHGHARHG
jgi:hypothetical protein